MNGKANKSSERKRQNNGLELNEILNSYEMDCYPSISPFEEEKKNSQRTLHSLLIPPQHNKINFLSLAQIFIYYFSPFFSILMRMRKL